MNFLILSRQHGLLPLANRLKKEGHDAEVLMYHAKKGGKYEKAYAGVIELVAHRGEKEWGKKIQALKELAQEGHCIVVTDAPQAAKDFHAAKVLYPTVKPERAPVGALRWGAWFDGEQFVAQHALIVDEGAWPGALGPRVDAAMTLIRVEQPSEGCPPIHIETDELKSRGFMGLVQWGLKHEEGTLQLADRSLGWSSLHTHAFIADQAEIGSILNGETVPHFPNMYTVVLSLTQPPWPCEAQHRGRESTIEGLTSEQMGHVFWHDVQVNTKERTIQTLGLDGFVGVVRGSANSLELAKAKVVDVAMAASFPEKQYRPDVGNQVRQVEALLESEMGIVLG